MHGKVFWIAIRITYIALIVALAFLLPGPGVALAEDTGWINPSANAADTGGDGDGFEVTPENAYSDGGGVAENIDGLGDRHRYYGYDFGLPGGATINGIEVRLDWYVDSAAGAPRLQVELSWDGGTGWTSPKQTKNGKTIEKTHVLGGPTDTWGHDWTMDELSDANFRVRITCDSKKSERDFYLDWVPVNVYDDPPTAITLDSFEARSGVNRWANLFLGEWAGVASLALLAAGGIFWVRKQLD